jgi:hypothetical protein
VETGQAAGQLKQAIDNDTPDLRSRLPNDVQLRPAAMSSGRGAGTVLPAIELWRSVTDDLVRITFWAGGAIAFAKAVRHAYDYVRAKIGHRPLVSPEGLIQLAAADVLDSPDAPNELRFLSITPVRDLHHAYSSTPYLPYDIGDVFVIVLAAGRDPLEIYGFVVAGDGTISHQWRVRVDNEGHPLGT